MIGIFIGRDSKTEIRNPKHETNQKAEKRKSQTRYVLLFAAHSDFRFVSCFVYRISSFRLLLLLLLLTHRLCRQPVMTLFAADHEELDARLQVLPLLADDV